MIDDKGKKGDANDAVIKRADRGQRAARPRAAQARVSAFLALEEAGHLPRHAAMVHRHGQGDRRGPSATLRDRALKAIDDTRWVPPQGENRIARHGRDAARLGRLAPARLGRADRRVRHKDTATVIPARLQRVARADRPHRRGLQEEGADAWFKDGAKERFLGRPVDDPADWEKVDDILDVWFEVGLDACLRARAAPRPANGRPTFISKAPTSTAAGSSPRCSKPAARAAARPTTRVVTHGFVRRRARAQDVEVARQRRRAAGRDAPVRRRDPASLGR